MVVRTGYQTFEFQEAREVRFGSTEDAVNWLKQLGYPDPDVMRQLRDLAKQYADDAAAARLSDEEVLHKVAVLLHTRRITVMGREHRTPSGQPAATAPAPAPAFPLSERASRATTASTPPPAASDPATFGPNTAGAAQAAALVAAAAAGTPFCQECSKS